MTIYLIWLDDHRCLFLADEATFHDGMPRHPPAGKSSGVRGYLTSRLERWKTSWREDQAGVISWLRRAWDWLHTWTRPDEPGLARLWSTHELVIRHPAHLAPGVPPQIWNFYLRGQFWRHLLWLVVNGVIAPLSVVLAVLPGPNVIGYWFAYRSIHHGLVCWGIVKARRSLIPITFDPNPELDAPIELDAEGKPRHVVLDGTLARLEEHVRSSRWLRWHKHAGEGQACEVDQSTTPCAETEDHEAPLL